ncbi:MAG: clostripain-related cysteine peptidase, partial [Bacillota bacterium]
MLQKENNSLKNGIRNSIIYLIHGDGSYLYHDSTGKDIDADFRILEQAKYVAENSPESEVFIFHIKPKENFLLFFPRKDRELFYYNKGILIKHESYNTEEAYYNLELESRYYKRYTQNSYMNPGSDSIKSFFLYYGHQIPEYGGNGYNSSYPEMAFNIDNFIEGLSQFRRYSAYKFDLVVLSTCNNGTPGVISKLAPYTKFAVASPEDLHLSYISSTMLTYLNFIKNYDLRKFTDQFASRAFENLKRVTQTVITVSVYDMAKVESFLENIKGKYDELLSKIENSNTSKIYCVDCEKNKFLNFRNYTASGVKVYYRPPQFGKSRTVTSHSGWGC